MPKYLAHWILFVVVLFSIPTPAAAQTQPTAPTPEPKVSAALQARLAQADAPVSVLVVMADQLDLAAVLADQPPSTVRVAAAYAALTAHAAQTQADLRGWLEERGVDYRPYYIANMVRVPADSALVQEISQREDVAAIVDNPLIYQTHARTMPRLFDGWQTTLGVTPAQPQRSDLMPYGLYDTKAVDVWATGYTGQGVVVASQDTGVEWTHPALQPRYRGWDVRTGGAEHVYNWFDAWETDGRPARCEDDAQVPCDDDGHGTHTVGTMLGNATEDHDRVGMAPDASWIGCRNMQNGFGTPASYAACFEFFLAPYPQGGDPFVDGRPALAPHIVNNSWGCPPSEGCDPDTLLTVVNNVRAAGIFVVSSAGNNGFLGCESVLDPIAIYDASLSVGAHAASGDIASFSSRGPVTADGSNRAKPDLTAPGVAVESATINNGYASLQGTSMASPHVAGAIALLWSAAPNLVRDIDTSEQILLKTATPVVISLCTSVDPVSPNNVFGYGRLNALDAVTMALNPMELTLLVTTDGTAPLADTAVRLGAEVSGEGVVVAYTAVRRAPVDNGRIFLPVIHAQ
jgi:serine protease AprX